LAATSARMVDLTGYTRDEWGGKGCIRNTDALMEIAGDIQKD